MALQDALGAHAVLLLALPLSVAGTFVSNGVGSPQSIAAAVCGGRSSHCAVDLDVPPACTNGECPVIFWLHGRGGTGAQSGWPGASIIGTADVVHRSERTGIDSSVVYHEAPLSLPTMFCELFRRKGRRSPWTISSYALTPVNFFL